MSRTDNPISIRQARSAARAAADLTRAGALAAAERALGATDQLIDAAKDSLERGRETFARSQDRLDEVRERLRHAESTDVDTRPYESRTYEELYELASEREIAGRSRLSKDELIEVLRAER
jgi:exonuclease VII small subunit